MKSKLSYILDAIKEGTIQNQKTMLLLNIIELKEAVENYTFSYQASYSAEKRKVHFYTYQSLGKRVIAKIISDLEEIERELKKRTTNEKRVIVLLKNLLDSDLYTVEFQRILNRWEHPTIKKLSYQTIYISKEFRK